MGAFPLPTKGKESPPEIEAEWLAVAVLINASDEVEILEVKIQQLNRLGFGL